MEERAELWAKVLELALKDSVRIWIADTSDYVPRRSNVTVAADLAAAVAELSCGRTPSGLTTSWRHDEDWSAQRADSALEPDCGQHLGLRPDDDQRVLIVV